MFDKKELEKIKKEKDKWEKESYSETKNLKIFPAMKLQTCTLL
jgi:hypothetical protein